MMRHVTTGERTPPLRDPHPAALSSSTHFTREVEHPSSAAGEVWVAVYGGHRRARTLAADSGGVHLVVDVGGAETLQQSLQGMRRGHLW
jgi:hypothetical protein